MSLFFLIPEDCTLLEIGGFRPTATIRNISTQAFPLCPSNSHVSPIQMSVMFLPWYAVFTTFLQACELSKIRHRKQFFNYTMVPTEAGPLIHHLPDSIPQSRF